MAGIRGDYNAYYDRFFLTPRGHLKWNITPSTTLRASGGLGYRSTNVITDNIGVLATGARSSSSAMNRGSSISGNSTVWRRP